MGLDSSVKRRMVDAVHQYQQFVTLIPVYLDCILISL